MTARERGLLIAGALLVVVGTFLPWMRSGAVWRNSYELWRSADRLGVVEGRGAEVVQVLWFLVPAAAGALLLAVAVPRRGLAHGVAVPLALLPLAGAVLVWRAPFTAGAGVVVTLVGAAIVGGTSAWQLLATLRPTPSRQR